MLEEAACPAHSAKAFTSSNNQKVAHNFSGDDDERVPIPLPLQLKAASLIGESALHPV